MKTLFIIVNPFQIQPRPPLGGVEEFRRNAFILVVVVIVSKTNEAGGGVRLQAVGHVPEKLPAAVCGVGVALRQHIDALRQQLQQGRQGGDSVLQLGKAAVEDFPQGIQFWALRCIQAPAGAKPAFAGFPCGKMPGQQRRAPESEAAGRFIIVCLWRQGAGFPAQSADPANMEQQSIPAPGLSSQINFCGEDADGLPIPGHFHRRSPPSPVRPTYWDYSSADRARFFLRLGATLS